MAKNKKKAPEQLENLQWRFVEVNLKKAIPDKDGVLKKPDVGKKERIWCKCKHKSWNIIAYEKIGGLVFECKKCKKTYAMVPVRVNMEPPGEGAETTKLPNPDSKKTKK